jgi:hypothetical protein
MWPLFLRRFLAKRETAFADTASPETIRLRSKLLFYPALLQKDPLAPFRTH